ncbi:MAG: pyridoxine 5'-phosphate synthase [Pseudomonadota bacterium]
MSAKLSVNLNAVAMLRNRRNLPWPSVPGLGALALEAGAAGLTVHPRPDERHIRRSDVPALRALIDDAFPDREYNVEGYPSAEFIALCIANEPDQVTLVPDDPIQSTSDHGWDFVANGEFLKNCVSELHEKQIRVSLFCDPDASEEQIAAAAATGAERVEIYTGPYGACYDDSEKAAKELKYIENTAAYCVNNGLDMNAGHDLTVENIPALAAVIPGLKEVSIGHALTSEALIHGMDGAVKRYLKVLGY